MKTLLHTAGALCLLAISFCPASRADLVTNGGFEAGNHLTGWTLSGDADHIFICGSVEFSCGSYSGFTFAGFPHSGTAALLLGGIDTTSNIQQTLTTVAGDAYDISFWVANCPSFTSCDPNSLTVNFGATTLFAGSDLPRFFFTEFTFNDVIASDASTVLSFQGEHDEGSYFLLDDISVTPAADVVAATPEPATLVTAGSGLVAALIAGLQRKRRSHTTSA